MLLASPNPSLYRGSHFPIVVAVVRLSPAHFRHDSGVELGPQVICDDALVMHVIPFQHACLFQFVECGNDLLKGAIDDAPSFVNVGFYLFQFRCAGFHISKSPLTSYATYTFCMIKLILEGCQKIYASGLANGSSRFALKRNLPKLCSVTRST